MGTVPQPKPTPEQEEAEHDRAVAWEAAMRREERLTLMKGAAVTFIAGNAEQAWRRPTLFIIAAATLAFAGPIGAIGLAALIALAYTDRVVTQETD